LEGFFNYQNGYQDFIRSGSLYKNINLGLLFLLIFFSPLFKIDGINKKFIYLDDKKYNIPYSLRDYCNKKKINYNLVEITGINNAQPLELRVSQTKYLLNSLFIYFNLL